MKSVSVSELKAKLARFLRLVKTGEEIEILERGSPIAKLTVLKNKTRLNTRQPLKNPKMLAKLHFKTKHESDFDIVDFLIQDRRR